MNFGQNLYQWFLSNAQSLVLMAIVVIGIYLGFKREFSKLIGFLVVALIAVGLVFNAGGVKDVLLELFNKIIGAQNFIVVLICEWYNVDMKKATNLKVLIIFKQPHCMEMTNRLFLKQEVAEMTNEDNKDFNAML